MINPGWKIEERNDVEVEAEPEPKPKDPNDFNPKHVGDSK